MFTLLCYGRIVDEIGEENHMISARLSGLLSRGRGMYARKDGMIWI